MSGTQGQRKSKTFWALLWALVVGAGTLVGLASGIIPVKDYLQGVTQDPIRVETSNITGLQCANFSGTVKQDFDPKKPGDYYYDYSHDSNKLLIPSVGELQMDVVSQAEDEELKVAPYALIQVTKIEPTSETVDYVRYLAGGCGGGWPTGLVATFSPNRDRVFGAPQLPLPSQREWKDVNPFSPRPEEPPFDYFTLTPGERDVFELLLGGMLPGYYYHFRIGVQYSYKGTEEIVWSDKVYVVGVPIESKAREWGATSGNIMPCSMLDEGAERTEGCVPRGYKGGFVKLEEGSPAEDMLSSPHMIDGYRKVSLEPKDPSNVVAERIKWEAEEIQKYQTSFRVPQNGEALPR